ncbi:hypothetical protein QCA50_003044 [Cerrena zonata]|uniref:Uncharacterized protein n=1 Tax=Cerrena zonata TaxID=2478898 RepID=A0AAW0GL95_9APHY
MTSPGPSQSRLFTLATYKSTSNARLKSLYSDFLRQKHSNPTSYASNLEWWRQTIESVVANGSQSTDSASPDRLVLHADRTTLLDLFKVEGVGKPLSLSGVIADLTESKAYYPISQFLNSTQSIYDPGWLPYRIASFVLGKPLWWALQQLNVVPEETAGGHESDSERWNKVKGDYVLRSLVEKAGERILELQKLSPGLSLADSLYSLESFKRKFASCGVENGVLSDLDLKVALKYLERDKRVIAVQGDVIKFVDIRDFSEPEITVVDTGLLALKTAIQNLQSQLDILQTRIEQETEKVSIALRRKQREVALSHLRTQKLLEDIVKKRASSLETLQATMLRVETAAGDVEIMKSYETSTEALRAILAHPSLQREKIDETMDAMSAATADAREIDSAIQMGSAMTQAEAGIDESDLADELQALVQEAEAAEEREKLERLTAEKLRAPGHSPNASEEAESWTDHETDEVFRESRTALNARRVAV